MIFSNYFDFIKKSEKISDKIFFVDGPRRCATNYTRSCFFNLVADKKNIAIILESTSHTALIYKNNEEYLHNKNIIHITPLRDIFSAITSNLIMHDYSDKSKENNYELIMLSEIYNYILYLNLEKKYKNVITLPLEIFNDKEKEIYSLIANKNDLENKKIEFSKNQIIKSLNNRNSANFEKKLHLKYHSYPIKEQDSEEYKIYRASVEIFVNNKAKDLISSISKKYEKLLEIKKEEFNV
jgi:hypothetical protein